MWDWIQKISYVDVSAKVDICVHWEDACKWNEKIHTDNEVLCKKKICFTSNEVLCKKKYIAEDFANTVVTKQNGFHLNKYVFIQILFDFNCLKNYST